MTSELEPEVLRLLAAKAWESRLVVRRGSHYVVVIRRGTTKGTRLELGADADGPEFETDATTAAALAGAGFVRTRRGGAHDAQRPGRVWTVHHADADGAAIQLIRRIQGALDLMGAHRGSTSSVLAVDAEPPPDNPRLIEAMHAVARISDVPTRQALYAALANARLIVPIDPATADGPPAQRAPLQLGQFDGGPILAVFADHDALRCWKHTGHPWAAVHGVDFFGLAQSAGVTTVRINPGGIVGGELYRTEVETIVDGIRRFLAQTSN